MQIYTGCQCIAATSTHTHCNIRDRSKCKSNENTDQLARRQIELRQAPKDLYDNIDNDNGNDIHNDGNGISMAMSAYMDATWFISPLLSTGSGFIHADGVVVQLGLVHFGFVQYRLVGAKQKSGGTTPDFNFGPKINLIQSFGYRC